MSLVKSRNELQFMNIFLAVSLSICLNFAFSLTANENMSGVIKSDRVSGKDINLHKRQRFESLLAGGRDLTVPFSVGQILSVISNYHDIWNVSISNLHRILDLSPSELLNTYKSSRENLEKIESVSTFSAIFNIAENDGGAKNFTVESLTALKTKLFYESWSEDSWNMTWHKINDYIVNNTNPVLDGKLIPKPLEGHSNTPFAVSTRSIIVSGFHYEHFWKANVEEIEEYAFEGKGKVPFLQLRGRFPYSKATDFTAVKVALENTGTHTLSITFILPTVDISNYLKTQIDVEDEVPLPTNWVLENVALSFPKFSFFSYEQFGRELLDVGMNETFCTTIRDSKGKIPYYLRPIVQGSFARIWEKGITLDSATGTAVEKFVLGLDILGLGAPRSEELVSGEESTTMTSEDFDTNETEKPGNYQEPSNNNVPEQLLRLDKPFLFYLEDSTAGPIFFGVVRDTLLDEDNDKLCNNSSESESMRKLEERQKSILWSCRSFKQFSVID